LILKIIDMPAQNEMLATANKPNLGKIFSDTKKILIDLDKDPQAYKKSDEHKRIYDLYKGINYPHKFKLAAENLRIQGGVKDRFAKGLGQMTLYLDKLKTIFKSEGLPEEIAY